MKSAPRIKPDTFIPPVLEISLEEFYEIYPEWLKYRITGVLPVSGGIRDQPERVMDGLLYIDSIFEKICNQVQEQISKEMEK